MKVRLRCMVQDGTTARDERFAPVEGFDVETEDFLLDGPVSRRIAVIDFGDDGDLRPGVKFEAAVPPLKLSSYRADENLDNPDFISLSTFSMVWKTLAMFEEEDTLGRQVRWAFEGRQLLVLPRAGVRSNAFYERESRSLQFFHFPDETENGEPRTVHTALSRDIVAHETAHAIIDGIAPDLYHAITPQALALHEGLADLTALIMAFRSSTLRKRVLDQNDGEISGGTAFSFIAEEFGHARDPAKRKKFLRSLSNDKTLDPLDDSRDEDGRPNRVTRFEPHLLSEVLSGALARVMFRMHASIKAKMAQEIGKPEKKVAGKALFVAGERFKRMIFRGLDYLPPGEISFVDYARAILASDQASYPDEGEERGWLREELIRRHIAEGPELQVSTDFEHDAFRDLDLAVLVESDWAAYEFANRNRSLLGIPEGLNFHVRPRLKATKLYYTREGKRPVTECIFKVSWDHQEDNPPGNRLPARRQITVGTVLAIDWETRRVRALLQTHVAVAGPQAQAQKADRDRLMLGWFADGSLRFALEQDDLHPGPWAEKTGDLMRIRGSARMLHIAAGERHPWIG